MHLLRVRSCILFGGLIFALQLLWVMSAGPEGSLYSRYLRLFQWDGEWYRNIVEQGYHSVLPPLWQRRDLCNVAYFPGYPILGVAVSMLTSLPANLALIVGANFCTLVFWVTLLLIFREWKVKVSHSILAVVAIFCYFTSYYFATAYSETLLISVIASLVWSLSRLSRKALAHQARWIDFAMVALFGVWVTLTRVTGAFVVALPAFWPGIRLRTAIFLSAIGCTGMLGFFIYCYVKWGAWDLYFQTQRVGWNVHPQLGPVFDPSTYFGIGENEFSGLLKLDPVALNRVTPLFFSGILFEFFLSEAWIATQRGIDRVRVWLWLGSAACFFSALMGCVSARYEALGRYSLPAFVLMAMAYVHQSSKVGSELPYWLRSARVGALILLSTYSIFAQRFAAEIYLIGQWMH